MWIYYFIERVRHNKSDLVVQFVVILFALTVTLELAIYSQVKSKAIIYAGLK